MSREFRPGWSAGLAQMGRDRFLASGRTFFQGDRFADDDRPLPRGFSLSGHLKWIYDQGPVGSCFANMMAHVMQIMMAVLIARGSSGKLFNPSRRLIWFRTRQLDGSLGSRYDGGSIVNSFASVGPAPHGLGDCSEEDWPYRADHNWLEATPPASVVKAADPYRIKTIAEVQLDAQAAAMKRAIYNGRPIGYGFDWCYGWDQGLIDQYGRTTGVGGAVGGHAIAGVGWLDDWDGHTWIEILNTHGKIYPTLPAEIAALVEGYTPNGSTFWIRLDHLAEVLGRRWAEAYIGSDVTSFDKREVTVAEGLAT